MKTIAVLLTVFNRKNKTLTCLQNLFAQVVPKGYTLEVYLVNDGCTDGTPEAVKKQFPQVNIIHAKGDLFWNRGMHLAWTTAAKTKDYNHYLWLNDDTILNQGAIETLLQTAQENENKAIIVGSTLGETFKTNQVTYGGRSKTKGLLKPEQQAIACDYFNGNIVLVPMAVYNKVGTHDPVFHHALGDFDYGLRAEKLGIKSFITPGYLGQCDVHTNLATWCNPAKPFQKRWRAFKSPLGNNPEEFFVFQKRHIGLIKALTNYITNHLRVVFPSYWIKK